MSATSEHDGSAETDNRAYLDQVMVEINNEVRARRASGDIPARIERQLDELFLEHSPVAGRGGSLDEALRMVDNAAFIDPVVPIDSRKSGGAAIKKGIRKLIMWYLGFITHQVSQFASATSRALHLVEQRLDDITFRLATNEAPRATVVDPPGKNVAEDWVTNGVLESLVSARGRVCHAGCGDGRLVQVMGEKGIDAYGIDPRSGREKIADDGVLDIREEGVAEHLDAVEPGGLAGLMFSGVTDGLTTSQRLALLEVAVDRLSSDGVLIVHSWTPSGWVSHDAPAAADLAPGKPWRPVAWTSVLERWGFNCEVVDGPTGLDFLLVATRGGRSSAK